MFLLLDLKSIYCFLSDNMKRESCFCLANALFSALNISLLLQHFPICCCFFQKKTAYLLMDKRTVKAMTQATSQAKKYKLGLALSGGGAKGFAHVGVFKFLEESGIKPDVIVGTSVGSLMGALFADGYTAEEIQDMFTGREFSEFAQLQLPKSGLFDTKRFRHFLKRQFRAKAIEQLETPILVMAHT